MQSLKEIFSFSRGETIAVSLLLGICLIGGSILVYQHSRQQLPADLIFRTVSSKPALPVPAPKIKPEPPAPDNSANVAQSANSSSNPVRSGENSIRNTLTVNINSASVESLAMLPHIGKTISLRIVEYRSKHGNFSSIDDLIAVYGVGPKTLERIRPFIICQ